VFVAASDVTALIGGALGGALLTGIVGMFRDALTERRMRNAATRVFDAEIKDAIQISCTTLKDGRWPIALTPRWSESWTAHRLSIANAVKAEGYADLEAAYRHLSQLDHVLEDESKYDTELEDPDRVFLLRGTTSCSISPTVRKAFEDHGGDKQLPGVLDRAHGVVSSK